MAALRDLYNLRLNQDLRARVTAACWETAVDVLQEAATTPNHDARVVWARKALFAEVNSPIVTVAMIAVAVRAHTFADQTFVTITDAEILNAVALGVNAMEKVT